MENFIDEVRDEPNKMNIKILSQSANNILAEITPAYKVITAGTPITAERMNEIKSLAETSNENSNIAKDNALQANTNSTNAEEKAERALSNSEQATNVANMAKTKAEDALTQVIEKQGSKVLINGEYVTPFNADIKANQSEFDEYKNFTNQSLTEFETRFNELQNKVTTLETEIEKMKNGTSVFTLLKANTIDLID